MRKKAISVSLEADNLAWLRGRALATGRISISALLDRVIRAVRSGGAGSSPTIRSVVGTIEIAPGDPELRSADIAVRGLVARSLTRMGTSGRVASARAETPRRARPRGRRTA